MSAAGILLLRQIESVQSQTPVIAGRRWEAASVPWISFEDVVELWIFYDTASAAAEEAGPSVAAIDNQRPDTRRLISSSAFALKFFDHAF